jgi:hypothetical protein
MITATLDGVILDVQGTVLGEERLRSPDHPSLSIPAEAGATTACPARAASRGWR